MTVSTKLRRSTTPRRQFFLNENNPWIAYLYLLPYGLVFCLFFLYPIFHGLWLSFTYWEFGAREQPFVGLENYIMLFTDDDLFLPSLKNTFLFVVKSVPLLILIGLGLALLLNERIKRRTLWRSMFVSPMVLTVSAMGLIWSWILDPQVGVLNYYLNALGLGTQRWILEPGQAMWVVVGTTIWWTVGFNLLIFMAGLQDIPEELYEAARMDGANWWQCFWSITLPALRPTMMFVTIIQVISSFKIFGQVHIITGGGPYNSTRVLVQHIYETGFLYFRMSDAAAMAWVLFLVIMVFTLIQLRYFGRRIEQF